MNYCIFNTKDHSVLLDGFNSIRDAASVMYGIVKARESIDKRNGVTPIPVYSSELVIMVDDIKVCDYLFDGVKEAEKPEPPDGFRLVRIQYCKDCKHRDFDFEEGSSESCLKKYYHTVSGENCCPVYEFAGKREETKPSGNNCRECKYGPVKSAFSVYCKKCEYFSKKPKPRNCRECEHGNIKENRTLWCKRYKTLFETEDAITNTACVYFKKKEEKSLCSDCLYLVGENDWCNQLMKRIPDDDKVHKCGHFRRDLIREKKPHERSCLNCSCYVRVEDVHKCTQGCLQLDEKFITNDQCCSRFAEKKG